MVDYSKYSEKVIRNKKNPDELEKALADRQAQEHVDRIVDRLRDEPQFLTQVVLKLAHQVLKTNNKKNIQDDDQDVFPAL